MRTLTPTRHINDCGMWKSFNLTTFWEKIAKGCISPSTPAPLLPQTVPSTDQWGREIQICSAAGGAPASHRCILPRLSSICQCQLIISISYLLQPSIFNLFFWEKNCLQNQYSVSICSACIAGFCELYSFQYRGWFSRCTDGVGDHYPSLEIQYWLGADRALWNI